MALNAYIVDAVRTPGGKKNGSLSTLHTADLGAAVLDRLVEKTGIPGAEVDDVIFGCVMKVGAQSLNVGRMCVLSSKRLPLTVPAQTVDRQCGSAQQAIHQAAQAVMSGDQDMVIAGGVEHMSSVPIGADVGPGMPGTPFQSKGIQQNHGEGIIFNQFTGAELLAKKYNLTRDELDSFALSSHKKAARAIAEGRFERELLRVEAPGKNLLKADEGVRPNASMEAMRKMRPLAPDGIVTAASSSQICDGAAAVLVVNERALKKYNLKPRARIVAMSVVGSDPVVMLEGPIPATHAVLKKANMKLTDMDLYEVNEAFAPVPLSWAKAVGADMNKLNVNGGACALGHPLGATGAKLMTTLVHELERTNGKYGLLAICEGAGTANATIIELVSEPVPTRSKL